MPIELSIRWAVVVFAFGTAIASARVARADLPPQAEPYDPTQERVEAPVPDVEVAEPVQALPPLGLRERVEGCSGAGCLSGRWFFQHVYSTDVGHIGRQLIRLHPRVQISDEWGGRVVIEAEGDFLTGRTFGDLTTTGASARYEPDDRLDAWASPEPGDYRQLLVRWQSAYFELWVGQTTSQWALGLVAIDGQDENHDLFDVGRHGDLVERAFIALKPFRALGERWEKLVLSGGFDVVFRDENALLTEDDLALQGVVALEWRDPIDVLNGRDIGVSGGVYVAIRDQEDRDGDILEVRTYDAFADVQASLSRGRLRFGARAEVAVIEGRSSRLREPHAAWEVFERWSPAPVDVLGLGAAVQLRLAVEDLGLEARFEVGYASGDGRLGDAGTKGFSFDPDYHVGMILFQEARGRAAGVSRETDGAITDAIYLNPILRYMSSFGLGAEVGVVAAWSDRDALFLGTEYDLGVRFEWALARTIWLKILVQGAVFLPDEAFDGPAGATLGTVSRIRSSVELGW